MHYAVFPTDAGLRGQTAVALPLPLGAKSVCCLDKRDQQHCSDGTDRRNLAQQLRRAMLPAFDQQLLLNLLVPGPQCLELLIVKFSPTAHAGFLDFRNPFGTMARCVNLLVGTGNGPTSVQSFQTNQAPREIFGAGQIAARQLLCCSQAGVFVERRS